MQTEFQSIIDDLNELLCVEKLEYLNKSLLNFNDDVRSKYKQDELKSLINRVNTLALDVAGQRPIDAQPEENTVTSKANGCRIPYPKMRQG